MSANIVERLRSGDLPLDFNWSKDRSDLIAIPDCIRAEPTPEQARKVVLVSEDLRDGLHGVPEYPNSEQMVQYIGKLNDLGIDNMTVGIYPGDGNKIDRTIKEVLSEMNAKYPNVTPVVLCQATENALKWLGDCKKINPKINALVFMGSAPSRMLVEEWSQEYILSKLEWAVKTATDMGVDVIGATEHTTQTPPEFLKKIIEVQAKAGAKYFCCADTIGIARPAGTYRLVSFVRQTLDNIGATDVKIDWHGHRDTGNELGNAMAAISAGADRVHVVAGGIGERAGNTPLESVLINLNNIIKDSDLSTPWDLSKLNDTLKMYREMVGVGTPDHGVMSARSTETSLGIHTAAILKASQLVIEARDAGDKLLAGKLDKMSGVIYTAVDPRTVGQERQVFVGPWSGSSTVKLACMDMGISASLVTNEVIQKVLTIAKQFGRELSKKELMGIINNHQ